MSVSRADQPEYAGGATGPIPSQLDSGNTEPGYRVPPCASTMMSRTCRASLTSQNTTGTVCPRLDTAVATASIVAVLPNRIVPIVDPPDSDTLGAGSRSSAVE